MGRAVDAPVHRLDLGAGERGERIAGTTTDPFAAEPPLADQAEDRRPHEAIGEPEQSAERDEVGEPHRLLQRSDDVAEHSDQNRTSRELSLARPGFEKVVDDRAHALTLNDTAP